MAKRIDLTGQKFGRLTVISYAGRSYYGHTQWKCKCDCGNEILTVYQSLKSGCTKSCGCLKSEISSETFKKLAISTHEINKEKDFKEGTSLCKLKGFPLKNNKSGVKGVCWDKRRNKWIAQIAFKGNHYYLGGYDTLEEAAKARKEAEEKYFQPILEKYGGRNEINERGSNKS